MGIVASVLQKFHGGVHPPQHKGLSEHCAIESLPMPKRLAVPLHQHLGTPCVPCVQVGERVLKGQVIGQVAGYVSAPVHAPTSGVVVGLEEHVVGHPSGLPMLCVALEPDLEDKWLPGLDGLDEPLTVDPKVIREKIKDAGIVGLGGAAFPSFIKMSPPAGKRVELLLINGVECEPYLTADARIMEERPQDVVDGIEIMLHALQAKECVVGIEDNKPAAILAMNKAVADLPNIRVIVLPAIYPQGSEKQLIEVVTKRQVPSGGLPIEQGVIVHNVATATAIREAVRFGRPLISRVVTMTGKGINRPANVEVLLGTPVADVIAHCGGLKSGVRKVIIGGPMMGVAVRETSVPVVKGTSGILAMMPEEVSEKSETVCIRCGSCVTACPISLVPCQMAWFAKTEQFEQLPEYNLFDCIECGSCAYVCPANIPLVHYFRYGKFSLQSAKRAEEKTALGKERSVVREARLAREQAEKDRKKAEMKAKMAAKKQAASQGTTAQPAELEETPADGDVV